MKRGMIIESAESPAANRRRRSAFTLVELLVVVAILALLIGMLMPTLGRSRDLARRATCAAQLNAIGKSVTLYVNDHGSYPPMGDNRFPGGWPKFYGILDAMDAGAPQLTRGVGDYSAWEADEVWDKCFCPGMNAVEILRSADQALTDGYSPARKPALHRAAAGYQWNVALRAAGPPMPSFPTGRWTLELWRPTGGWQTYDNTVWTDYTITLPGQSSWYICQAVTPQELLTPSSIAEAWDSHDFNTIPGMNVRNAKWDVENLVPGWHVGPQTKYMNGWAALNGARHPGSPNILYADGHVRANATKRLAPSDLGGSFPYGSLVGSQLNSWDDYRAGFGTLHYIVPRTEIRTSL